MLNKYFYQKNYIFQTNSTEKSDSFFANLFHPGLVDTHVCFCIGSVVIPHHIASEIHCKQGKESGAS